ncbi:rCG43950 [Rattus norvegicus]|nr:rCG43950 [Rattus norvegicus]
MKNKIKM